MWWAALALTCACGNAATGPVEPDARRPADPVPGAQDPPGLEVEAELRALEALGYAGASSAVDPGGPVGVVRHEPERAEPGWNLLTSGHGPEAILYDMEGRELHSWRKSFSEAWPERKPGIKSIPEAWRRVRLEPDGELFAIFEGLGLIKLDRDSNLLWTYDGLAHHALDVAPDGRILVLTRRAKQLPRFNTERPILEDFLTTLDPGGRELEVVSLIECFERSDQPEVMEVVRRGGDVFHTNALKLLDGSQAHVHPEFQAGRVLISLRRLDLLAVVDPQERRVVWTLRGSWRRQHEPSLLASGALLLFDNQGLRRRSRVLEVDPASGAILWSFAEAEKGRFYSATCGSCQRLPGGNTLITDSEAGRAFEVTPAGETVWEFRNPFRAGEHGELTPWVFELLRLDARFPMDWLE